MDTYTISIEQRESYLFFQVQGENTVETIRRYSADIRQACARLRQSNVLVVVDLKGPRLSMLEVYKAVVAGADQAAGLVIQAAYVDLNPASDITNMQIAEDVATTRGIPVRTFRDIASAEAWLLSRIK